MTVGEYFESERVNKDFVSLLSDESEYWAKASNFVVKTWNDDMEEMSNKQVSWLSRILDDCIEKRINEQRRA